MGVAPGCQGGTLGVGWGADSDAPIWQMLQIPQQNRGDVTAQPAGKSTGIEQGIQ